MSDENEPKRVVVKIDFFHGRHTAFEFFRPDVLAKLFHEDEVTVSRWLNMLCDDYDSDNPPPEGWEEYFPVMSLDVYAQEGTPTRHRVTMFPHFEGDSLDDMITAVAVGIVGMYCEAQEEFSREEFYALLDDRIREYLLSAQPHKDEPGVTKLPVFTTFRNLKMGKHPKKSWYKRLFGR